MRHPSHSRAHTGLDTTEHALNPWRDSILRERFDPTGMLHKVVLVAGSGDSNTVAAIVSGKPVIECTIPIRRSEEGAFNEHPAPLRRCRASTDELVRTDGCQIPRSVRGVCLWIENRRDE
jgi:hypothetical protein